MDTHQLLELKLDQVGMSPALLRRLLDQMRVLDRGEPQTVRDAMDVLGNWFGFQKDRNGVRRPVPESGAIKQLKERLLALGLTPEVWPRLAPNRELAAACVLNQASQDTKVLLATSVLCLPFTNPAFARLEYAFQRPREEVTVGEIVTISQGSWGGKYATTLPGVQYAGFECMGTEDLTAGIRSVRSTLRTCGLKPEHGVFMSEFTRLGYIEEISKDLNVSPEAAMTMFDYFKGQGWHPRLEE